MFGRCTGFRIAESFSLALQSLNLARTRADWGPLIPHCNTLCRKYAQRLEGGYSKDRFHHNSSKVRYFLRCEIGPGSSCRAGISEFPKTRSTAQLQRRNSSVATPHGYAAAAW